MKPVVVAGLGEVGKPLAKLLKGTYQVSEIDLETRNEAPLCSVLHICFPYDPTTFLQEVNWYIEKTEPELVIIESTVLPGTTDLIRKKTKAQIVHSPVRGVHTRMFKDLVRYKKYIGPTTRKAGKLAAEHYRKAGLEVRLCKSALQTEYMKLFSLTYYGYLISWAQWQKMHFNSLGIEPKLMDEWNVEIHEKLDNRPVYRPGFIGGHCVIPGINLLQVKLSSRLLDSVLNRNATFRYIYGGDNE